MPYYLVSTSAATVEPLVRTHPCHRCGLRAVKLYFDGDRRLLCGECVGVERAAELWMKWLETK